MSEHVLFLTTEDGDDLIVSFALGDHAEKSITLLRTPKYEYFLPEDERGVSVGTGASGAKENEFLQSVKWGKNLVQIDSTIRHYKLNMQAVQSDEIQEAKLVLRKMNFDNSFEIIDV
jgi:hypothetical protein